jgi:sulfoxide reductase catalytic subunit YedY
MLIRHRKVWDVPEHRITPETVFLNRRRFLAAGAATAIGGAVAASMPKPAQAQWFSRSSSEVFGAPEGDPSTALYPMDRNPAYTVARDITGRDAAFTYNNFYEFGSHKQIARAAQALEIRPWTVKIDGMVDNPAELAIDDLLKKMPLEERVYRFRCVEAWAMTVPWSGFPMAALVAMASPKAGAKYVRMETFLDTDMAPGQRTASFGYPWPYVEGLTLAEATNDLAFIGTGAYGAPLPKQMGSPIRLLTPWKYGFKSAKSLVRFTFTDEMPKTFWADVGPAEYGFWANVNPDIRIAAGARPPSACSKPMNGSRPNCSMVMPRRWLICIPIRLIAPISCSCPSV